MGTLLKSPLRNGDDGIVVSAALVVTMPCEAHERPHGSLVLLSARIHFPAQLDSGDVTAAKPEERDVLGSFRVCPVQFVVGPYLLARSVPAEAVPTRPPHNLADACGRISNTNAASRLEVTKPAGTDRQLTQVRPFRRRVLVTIERK